MEMIKSLVVLAIVAIVAVNGVDEYKDGRFIKTWARLTEIPKNIPINATYVRISLNDIRTLKSGDFSQLSKCKQMILDDNSIANIKPGSFNGLTSLTNLSICDNWITKIRSKMWRGLENLEELTLCTNLFGRETQIRPRAFSTLPNLRVLRLGYHGLNSLQSNMWTGLDKLNELIIFKNYISILEPETFKLLVNLKSLSLRENTIYKLKDGALNGLSNLEDLDLYYNELGAEWNDLSRIRPGMWEGIPSLQRLGLGKNWITVLNSGSFSNLPELTDLDLSENKLTTLTPDLFEPAGHPDQLLLDLGETRLKCDANLCWMKEGVSDGWLELRNTTEICEEFTWEEVPENCA